MSLVRGGERGNVDGDVRGTSRQGATSDSDSLLAVLHVPDVPHGQALYTRAKVELQATVDAATNESLRELYLTSLEEGTSVTAKILAHGAEPKFRSLSR